MKLERRPLIPRAELRRGISECVAQGRELLGWLVDPHGAVHTRQAPEDRKDFEPECCPIRHNVHWRWRLRFEGDRKGKPHKHGDSRPLEKDGSRAKHWTSHGSGGKRDKALLAWAKANWIVEPGRIVGSQRVRHPTEPSLQVALMPGLDFRSGPLGRSSLSSVRQSLLLSAAERSSLWELRFAPREEVAAAIEWGMDAGWVTVAAERGEAGKRTGTWTDLPSEFALLELENSGNWSAGPY